MGISLRPKEQPSSTNTAIDAVHNRYVQPRPPTVLERLAEAFKRFGRLILLSGVVLAVFLVIPFRSWDDYTVWSHIQEALIRLGAQPDALPNFKQVMAAAKSANILWDQPSGARPEKWYHYAQRNRYDAHYGVVQVLAIGLIKHGESSRGASELGRLQQRAGLGTVPSLPSTDQVITTCSQCTQGKIEEKCQACDGQGSATIPTSKSAFPLTGGLGGTGKNSSRSGKKLGDEAIRVTHKCPTCDGTGKHAITCPTCRGRTTIIRFAEIPNVFQNTLTGTVKAIDKDMTLRRIIHIAANVQRAFLRKGGELSSGVLAVAQDDTIFNSTNSANAFLQPAPIGKSATTDATIAQDPATGEHRNVTQSLSEKRLQIACETLQLMPLSVANLQILADVARSETNNPALRGRAMAAYALALLMQGNTNAFSRAAQIQRDLFPDPPPLITITPTDCMAPCTDCLGKGEKRTGCPFCRGTGKCETCDGIGNITGGGRSHTPCPSCKLSGICVKCEGQARLIITCPTCKGAGENFTLTDAVRNNYSDLLSNMVAICQGKGNKAEPPIKAEGESDHDLQNNTTQAVTNRLSAHETTEAQNRSQREVESLRKLLLENSIGGSIATLRTYLAAHPESPYQTELQHLLDGLIAKQERKHLTRNIVKGGTILIGAFLFTLILRPRLFRKHAATAGALPGMEKLNKADFIDPLTLTARDSRARSNNATSGIPLPDKTDVKR